MKYSYLLAILLGAIGVVIGWNISSSHIYVFIGGFAGLFIGGVIADLYRRLRGEKREEVGEWSKPADSEIGMGMDPETGRRGIMTREFLSRLSSGNRPW